MPDKWEYPWFAAWDMAFHMIPFAMIDPDFAKDQLILLTREWYMHPNGQIPAYEWAFGDVNPPVHAWAAMRVYQIEQKFHGRADRDFLERVFQKLLINFTWWVNRKDAEGNNIFEGGFLGLDNISVFDRTSGLPAGGRLEQADGTSWMATYCLNLLGIALELAKQDPVYEDVATKFFEHFVYIGAAINRMGGARRRPLGRGGRLLLRRAPAAGRPLHARSRRTTISGLIPLFAVAVADREGVASFPDFAKRLRWFTKYRPELLRGPGRHDAARRAGPHPPRARRHATSSARMLRPVLDPDGDALAARRALGVEAPPRASVRARGRRHASSRSTTRRRIDDGALRRQLELARAGLVPAQLPADRGAAAARRGAGRRPSRSSARPARGTR